MAAISQMTFSNAFSWLKIYEFRLTFHWNLFLRFKLTIFSLVQITAWRRPGDKPLSEPMMLSLLTQICITLPQWFNPLHAQSLSGNIIHIYNSHHYSTMEYHTVLIFTLKKGKNTPFSIVNTLRPRKNGLHFPDDIFKCIFLNETISVSLEILLKFAPNGPINNIQAAEMHITF